MTGLFIAKKEFPFSILRRLNWKKNVFFFSSRSSKFCREVASPPCYFRKVNASFFFHQASDGWFGCSDYGPKQPEFCFRGCRSTSKRGNILFITVSVIESCQFPFGERLSGQLKRQEISLPFGSASFPTCSLHLVSGSFIRRSPFSMRILLPSW